MLSIRIRRLKDVDLNMVRAIERKSFRTPWTKKDFRHILSDVYTLGLIAETPSVVPEMAGYIIYDANSPRQIQILNLAVHPDFVRQGVASQLVGRLQKGSKSLYFLIGEANLPAQLFLRKLGFKATTTERNYFAGGEAAYRFHHQKQRAA